MSKNVLITGGAGFIGHHVIDYLLRKTDWNLISLDRLDFSGTLNRLHEVVSQNNDHHHRVKVVWHDLKAEVNDFTIKEIGEVDYILHLAAGSHVDRSIENPMEFVYDNVVGTANLLEYARKKLPNLEKFLYFSTDEVFGPAPEGVFYKENDRYNSGNPYSATKAGAEELCVAYENTYKMPIMITHTMNVFGIRQHSEKYIPKIIRNVLSGEKLTIHADRTCSRPGSRHYINTEDVADSILFLLEEGQVGEKYNIVGKEEVDNLELALIISKILNRPLNYELVDYHSSRPGHDLRYAMSGEKMKKMGWEPKKSLKDRINEVIKWSLENERWIR